MAKRMKIVEKSEKNMNSEMFGNKMERSCFGIQ